MDRAEAYDGESLPEDVLVVTAGVDVQDDRLEVQLIGWGENEQSWPFLYEVLHGDPAQTRVWQELDRILLGSFRTESDRVLRVRAGCIDTGGHHSATVLAFCRPRRVRRIFPTKGAAGARPVWPKRASRTRNDEPIFLIGVDAAKDALYGRLKIAKPGPGYIHFPATDGFDQTYFDQLTAEEVVTRYREGRPYRVWVLRKGRRNEALDTFVLAMAARQSLPGGLKRQVEFTVEASPMDGADPVAPVPPSPGPEAGATAPVARVRPGRPWLWRRTGQPWLARLRPLAYSCGSSSRESHVLTGGSRSHGSAAVGLVHGGRATARSGARSTGIGGSDETADAFGGVRALGGAERKLKETPILIKLPSGYIQPSP